MAGAHIWNYQDDVVHVRYPFLTVHCTGTGQRVITLPGKCCAFNLLRYQWAAIDSTHLRFNGQDGTTHIFLVGSKSEIEALLSQDLSELLYMKRIPPRPENTIQLDAVHFDVPIMKLDQWIEEEASETAPEDLIFKPSMLDIDLPETQSPSPSRKRTRKTQGGQHHAKKSQKSTKENGSETPQEIKRQDSSFDVYGVNIVFRKRE
jgi:hypothetical protein